MGTVTCSEIGEIGSVQADAVLTTLYRAANTIAVMISTTERMRIDLNFDGPSHIRFPLHLSLVLNEGTHLGESRRELAISAA